MNNVTVKLSAVPGFLVVTLVATALLEKFKALAKDLAAWGENITVAADGLSFTLPDEVAMTDTVVCGARQFIGEGTLEGVDGIWTADLTQPVRAPIDENSAPPGSWASVAQAMAAMFPEGPGNGQNWDDWKDEAKEAGL